MAAKTRRSAGASPDGLLRVAICGCGAASRRHVRALLEIPDVDVVALADIRHENCSRLRDEELVPRGRHCSLFHNLKEQLRLAHLDAVVLSTPPHLHHEQARTALRAGVHVLLETPMALTVVQARELVRLAERRRKVLALGYRGPYSPEFGYVRRMRRAGVLGEIHTVQGTLARNWLHSSAGTWRLKRKLAGGGVLQDVGGNLLNAVLWLTELKPTQVFAFTQNLGRDVDVLSGVLIRFENGALGTLSVNGNSGLPRERIEIYGSQGAVHTSIFGEFLEHYVGADRVKYPTVPGGAGSAEANFVAAIRGQEELLCPGDFGVRVARLVQAIYTSARTGRMVRLAR